MLKIKKKVFVWIIYFACLAGSVQAQEGKDLLQKSKEALEKNKIKESITLAKQVIELKYNIPEAYISMGLAYYAFSEYDKAIDAYTEALKFDPKYKDAYYNRGVAYYWVSKNTLALEDFKKALEIDSKDARTYTALGVLYVKLAETENNTKYTKLAQESYLKAIEVNAQYASSYYNLALLETEKHPKKALEHLNTYLTLKKDADGYLLRGILYNNSKQYNKALSDLNEALNLRPYDPEIHLEKAWALHKTNQTQEACTHWKKAQTLGSSEAEENLKRYCK